MTGTVSLQLRIKILPPNWFSTLSFVDRPLLIGTYYSVLCAGQPQPSDIIKQNVASHTCLPLHFPYGRAAAYFFV